MTVIRGNMDHEELMSNWNRMDKAVVDVGLTAAAMSAMSEEIDRLRQRAEAAEVIAREQAERNLHNIDLCTQALQQRDAAIKRAEATEAALAAVPVEALKRTLLTGYRTDAQITADADAINAWLGEAQP